jgi:hypothetical protein
MMAALRLAGCGAHPTGIKLFPMEMTRVQVVVTLDESVKVTSEVLGAEELTTLEVGSGDKSERVPVRLCFPLSTRDATGQLDPPHLCFPELSGGKEWGRRRAAVADIFSLLVAAHLPVELEGVAHIFATSCVPWVRQLADWLAVLTGQLVGTRHRPGLPPLDASHVKAALDTGTGIKPVNWITLDRPRPKRETPAHLKHLKHALDHLSRNELAPLPYTLLIDAQTEEYRGAYERAIMDAYVAAETALAQATGHSAHTIYKCFTGRRWKEIREKWPDIPDLNETMSSLVRVRNQFAAHTRLEPATAAHGYHAVRVATQIVAAIAPADPPCSALPAISSCPWRPIRR